SGHDQFNRDACAWRQEARTGRHDRGRNFRAGRRAEQRHAARHDSRIRQQDVHRAPGRQVLRRHDQADYAARAGHHSGSQRSTVAGQAARSSQIVAIARGRQGMTATRGLALVLTVAAAGAWVNASAPADGPAAIGSARLKTISSRISANGASLVIEASDPVGYVATYPDPLTVVLDFRNVVADGVA